MTELLTRAYSPGGFRKQGHALIDQLADYLEDVNRLPANPYATPEESLERFRQILDRRTTPHDVFAEVIAESVHLHHPEYMGHQVVPPAPVAALSDLVSSLLNTGMAVFEMGRPGTAMEKLVIERFASLLGLAPTADGFLTSGGSLANLTALLCARAKHGPADRPCLLVSEHAHYCIERAVRVMGWGEEGIIHLPTDAELRVRVDQVRPLIEQARQEGRTPIALVGSACTTATGTFDPLEELGQVATNYGLWFHVDGAHGAAVRLSPQHRHLVRGLERADSVTLDFHKMLMVPAITTGLFFRDGKDAYRTFHQRAEYLLTEGIDEDWSNIAKRSFECTKRMLSLRVFTLLSAYGPQVFQDYVDGVANLGSELARLIRQQPDLELFMQPDINIVCFRFVHVSLPAISRDGVNEMIRDRLTRSGQTYIVQTRINGQVYLRCTLTNPFTTVGNLEKMLLKVASIGHDLTALRYRIG
ncbi:pyridoxal phosphate-dependent decarboxylase family protein [Lewinella sp. IMCC34191]|uniref:pyridoxal phosphate-dependent decarboxylase family protein n=1 Tax=Lewinella sp. IMCC34191 TaxID=2259172 RepID=UPI000E26CF58|nr:pyridoxal-dependent decarboxylase [Lewinella sp. IMCC34191]